MPDSMSAGCEERTSVEIESVPLGKTRTSAMLTCSASGENGKERDETQAHRQLLQPPFPSKPSVPSTLSTNNTKEERQERSPGRLAIHRISSAISCATRGCNPSYTFLAASASPRNRVTENSVSTMPGQTSLTRMLYPTSSRRREPEKAATACSAGGRASRWGQLQVRSFGSLSSLVWTTDESKLTRGSVDRASGIRFCRSRIKRRLSVSSRAERSLGPISTHVSARCPPFPAIEPRLMMLKTKGRISFPSRLCPRIEMFDVLARIALLEFCKERLLSIS